MMHLNDKFSMTGIILAGGKSSRMGRDKALLKFGRKTLLEQLVSLSSRLFSETLVIVNDRKKLRGLDLGMAHVYEDAVKEQGPLGGIYTGFVYSRELISCVLTCDMPFVNEFLICELIRSWDPDCDAICYKEPDGNVQPFPGIYRRVNRILVRSFLNQGENSMNRFLKLVDVKFITYQREKINFFTNMNKMDDYLHALNLKDQIGQWT